VFKLVDLINDEVLIASCENIYQWNLETDEMQVSISHHEESIKSIISLSPSDPLIAGLKH